MAEATRLQIEVLRLLNEERAEHRLKPLLLDTRLSEAAADHSADMARGAEFSHTGPGGTRASDRIRESGFDLSGSWATAENLAMRGTRGHDGLEAVVRAMHDHLMSSPGHRANILRPDLEAVGLGFAEGPRLGQNVLFLTEKFARTGAGIHSEGSDGADRMVGTAGDDVLRGHGGNDLLRGGAGHDRLYGDGGNDVLLGGAGHDRLWGGAGNDRLFGNGGNDRLYGGPGDDYLSGGAGRDMLRGGKGDDTLRGGKGADVFVFGRADGSDRILDFEPDFDHIRIVSGARRFSDLAIRAEDDDTAIRFGETKVTLEGISPREIDAGDFWFG